jgi:hypothetical protein
MGPGGWGLYVPLFREPGRKDSSAPDANDTQTHSTNVPHNIGEVYYLLARSWTSQSDLKTCEQTRMRR